MRVDEIRTSVARPVKDIYGRYVGTLTVFSSDGSENVKSVGVDVGSGVLRQYPANRFVFGDDGPILLPEWKLVTEGMGREISVLKKRIETLKVLASAGEVSPQVFEELSSQYSSKLETLEESYSQILDSLSRRASELDEEIASIEQFMVEVKIQYRSAELDDQTYQLVSGNCATMRAKNVQEKEEISRLIKAVPDPISTKITMTINQSPTSASDS